MLDQASFCDGEADVGAIWKSLELPGDVARGPDKADERDGGQIVATVFAAERAGDLEAVLAARFKRAKSAQCFFNQRTHVPVTEKLLVPGQSVKFFSIAGDDLAGQVFWAYAPVVTLRITNHEIAEVILSDDMGWIEASPSPCVSNVIDECHDADRLT